MTAAASRQDSLAWRRTRVDGHDVRYGVIGRGAPLVFLHGWGLNHRAYGRALAPLGRCGVRVYAPALPGFGGTRDLASGELTMAGYAAWVARFLDAIGVIGPVTLVGHSFGGGVAIQTAHDHPRRVAGLVVVNSIGGATWSETGGITRSLRDRPLWDWGLHLQADVLPWRQLTRILPVIAEEALPNLVGNPRAIWRVARLARTADLTAELEELKRRRLPVVILWGRGDTVLPPASLESLRSALSDPALITVPGKHSWLLADPGSFAEVMTNVVGLPGAIRPAA